MWKRSEPESQRGEAGNDSDHVQRSHHILRGAADFGVEEYQHHCGRSKAQNRPNQASHGGLSTHASEGKTWQAHGAVDTVIVSRFNLSVRTEGEVDDGALRSFNFRKM